MPQARFTQEDIAGIGSRFIAALLDTTIIAVSILIFLSLALVVVGIFIDNTQLDEVLSTNANRLTALFSLVGVVLLGGFYTFFEISWGGQSPGKRVMGLRVVQMDGEPLTTYGALLRNIFRIIDFLPLFYGIGLVSMFIDSRSRRLGDLVAGTMVVHKRGRLLEQESLDKSTVGDLAPAAFQINGILIPVEKLTIEDFDLIDAFFQRRAEIPNAGAIAHQILTRLSNQMGIILPPQNADETIQLLKHIQASAGR